LQQKQQQLAKAREDLQLKQEQLTRARAELQQSRRLVGAHQQQLRTRADQLQLSNEQLASLRQANIDLNERILGLQSPEGVQDVIADNEKLKAELFIMRKRLKVNKKRSDILHDILKWEDPYQIVQAVQGQDVYGEPILHASSND